MHNELVLELTVVIELFAFTVSVNWMVHTIVNVSIRSMLIAIQHKKMQLYSILENRTKYLELAVQVCRRIESILCPLWY